MAEVGRHGRVAAPCPFRARGVTLCLLILCAVILASRADASASEMTYGLPVDEVRRTFLSVIRELNGGVLSPMEDPNYFKGPLLDGTCELRLLSLGEAATTVNLKIDAPEPREAETLERMLLNLVQARLAGRHEVAGTALPGELQDAARARQCAVVCIFGTANNNSIQTSGVAVSPSGLILTTAHDLQSSDRLVIQLSDGRVGRGDVLVCDTRYDLAVLRSTLAPSDFVPIERAEGALPATGTPIWTLGCPLGLSGTSARGTVTAPPRLVEESLLIQSDLPAHPGSSGSPVFDGEGRLIALVKGRLRGLSEISFLIPTFYADPLLAQGDSAGAQPEGSQPSRPATASEWLSRALAAKEKGPKEKALLNALELAPDSLPALYHLGILYSSWPEKIDQETRVWAHLAGLKPDWGEIYFRLGNCHFRAGRLDEADKTYRKALDLLNDNPWVFNNLGEVLRRKRRWREAERTLRQALALDPDYAPAHYNLGILYDQNLNRPELALYHYRQYLKLNPQAQDAKGVKAWVKDLEGRL